MVSTPIVAIHECQCFLVLALVDEVQQVLAGALHSCVDEIVPGGDGEPMQDAVRRLQFQVKLAHYLRHFAFASAFVHERSPFCVHSAYFFLWFYGILHYTE